MTIDTSDSKMFVSLVGQVQKIAENFRDDLNEADRVAALAAAQKLVQSLEKPKEAVIKMAFSVRPSISTMSLSSSHVIWSNETP